jgi:lysophospholipase L1-like esterase/predicted esterase
VLTLRTITKLWVLTGALFFLGTPPVRAADSNATTWFSLEGKPVPTGNTPSAQGLVRKFDAPVLGVTRTSRSDAQGTILLLPGGGYGILDVLNEGSRTAEALNVFGFDVVMLEYHVGAGAKSRDLALEDAQATWRLLKEKPETLSVKSSRLVVMGYSAGGHLATRLLQTLPENQQPDDVILAYPAYLEETTVGSETPAVAPPTHLKSRLAAIMASDDRANWLKGCRDYVGAWQKAGGYGVMLQLKSGGHGFGMKPGLTGDLAQWPNILNYFLENGPKPGVGPFNSVLPWFLPNLDDRLATFKKEKSADQKAVVFLGDSITSKWALDGAFREFKVANRGISGDTTRGMLCRFQDNVLDLHPTAIVILGGINDLFGQPRGTPESISANVRSILEQARTANRDTPILVCEVLPCKTMSREVVTATNIALAKVVTDFANARLVKTYAPFLKADGTQNETLFVDGTHPNAAGYEVWQSLLQPELAKYAYGN